MKKINLILFLSLVGCCCVFSQSPTYIFDSLHMADPSAHVFNGKIYIYPSHDINSDKTGLNGSHYDMKDYHVLTFPDKNNKAIDNGVALDIKNVKWADKQMWAPDCVFKNGRYYFYFPAKDKQDIFRIGMAVSKSPTGPFKAEPNPIKGSYSIDPAVLVDTDGQVYMYFGGLNGGQLQQYRNNIRNEKNQLPADNENALCPKVVKLNASMKGFTAEPKDLVILDEAGQPLKAGDTNRRFFEGAWMHKYKGKYYFSYSTGTSHFICYAISDSPWGPFTYKGIILSPVEGWTTHHSILEYNNNWYLFYHDSKKSGKNYLRSIKIRKLQYNPDGTIETMNGLD